MKRRTLIVCASLLFVVSCFVFLAVSKKDVDPSITVEQLSLDALPSEIAELGKELEGEGAEELKYFEISSIEEEPLYVELSGRRVFQNGDVSEFEVFLQFPQDKERLVSKTYQNKTLIVSYRTESTLHEHMTNSLSTSMSNAASVDLGKKYCAFIPAIGPVEKDGTRLGYAVFSDDKMIIDSMKEDPDSIEKKISEDDFVYEYRLTAELIKTET